MTGGLCGWVPEAGMDGEGKAAKCLNADGGFFGSAENVPVLSELFFGYTSGSLGQMSDAEALSECQFGD